MVKVASILWNVVTLIYNQEPAHWGCGRSRKLCVQWVSQEAHLTKPMARLRPQSPKQDLSGGRGSAPFLPPSSHLISPIL